MVNDQINLEKIVQLLPGSIYWKNRAGIYLGCNEACAKLLQLKSPNDIIGKTLFELLPNELSQYAEIIANTDEEVMSKNCEKILEERGPNNDGKIITYLTKKTPLHDEQGNVTGLIGISVDLSLWKNTEVELIERIKQSEHERQLSNTYLSNMLAHLPENFYWVDKDSNVLGCNENQARILGFKNSKELIGKNICDVGNILGWDKEVADRIRQNDLEVMRTRKIIKSEEQNILNNEIVTFITVKSPLIGLNDEVIGVFGISVDVTEKIKIQNALEEALKKAEAANISKSNFIRNMSHDLRTPFAGILGFATYLEETEQDFDKKEKLGYIKQSCEKLLTLINDVLHLTSVETGQQQMQLTETNIKTIIEDVEILMLAQIKNKRLNFFINYHDNLPDTLILDKTRVHRILLNLLSNAIKFTDSGSISIDAYISDSDATNNSGILNLEISDTGIGIPSDKIDIIFERFTRLTNSYESKYEGSGLGLYIVKQLINDCGGSIEVESKVNVGSKFKCKLPYLLPTS